MRHTRRLLLLGLAAGAGAGAIAAVAIPQTRAAPGTADRVLRVAAPISTPPGMGYLVLRPTSPLDVAVTIADPRGGPPWAVREYLADRLAPPLPGGRGRSTVVGHSRCVQLGRVYRGQFGWLTADGTFRPVTSSFFGAPTQCPSVAPDPGGVRAADVVSTISNPDQPVAEIRQTIVYGLAGPAARDPRLSLAGRPLAIRLGRAGTLLAVLAPSTQGSALGLTVGYPRRATATLLPVHDPFRSPPGPGARLQQPVSGAAPALAAQAPDPDGGLPFGMTATPTGGGGFCTSTGGRVVDDRVGSVDYSLDVLSENGGAQSTSCPSTRPAGARARLPGGRSLPPYSLSESFDGGAGSAPGADPRPGRVARRSPPGLVIYSGTAEPTVRYLTFATPRDVRTIAPSGPAHAFIIVYAGSFPTGDTTITTTFRDGGTRTDDLSNPGF